MLLVLNATLENSTNQQQYHVRADRRDKPAVIVIDHNVDTNTQLVLLCGELAKELDDLHYRPKPPQPNPPHYHPLHTHTKFQDNTIHVEYLGTRINHSVSHLLQYTCYTLDVFIFYVPLY